jgi:hypothetical protein
VFEDGPKRDMRLWIGDLRCSCFSSGSFLILLCLTDIVSSFKSISVQALTSYSTFKDYKLAKRCLYLIAAMPFPSGKLPAGVFEKPRPCRAGDYIVDYGLLYCSSLLEYVEASGDFQAGHDLYASALAQFAFALAYLNEDNVIACPVLEDKGFKGLDPENWHFIDCSSLSLLSLREDRSEKGRLCLSAPLARVFISLRADTLLSLHFYPSQGKKVSKSPAPNTPASSTPSARSPNSKLFSPSLHRLTPSPIIRISHPLRRRT